MKQAADYFENGRLKGFEPDFKSLRADIIRYLDQLNALIKDARFSQQNTGNIEHNHHSPFDTLGWVIDLYLEKRLFDEVEANLKPNHFASPHHFPNFDLCLEKLLGLGENKRVQRICSAAAQHVQDDYWRHIALLNEHANQSSSDLDDIKQEIELEKSIALKHMGHYRRRMELAHAPASIFTQIDADIAAINTETRKPLKKNNQRQM